jgi:hypothetical protein
MASSSRRCSSTHADCDFRRSWATDAALRIWLEVHLLELVTIGCARTSILEHLMETHATPQREITDDSLPPTWSGEALDSDPILLRLLTEPAPATAA